MASICRTAMVVEDDVILRTTIAHYLEDTGLEVVEAGTGDEALKKFKNDPAVDLLVTDVLMPGDVDGLKLAHHVTEHWPGTHIIVASAINVPLGKVPAQAVFLSKPYRFVDVDRAVKRLCGAGLL